MTTESPRWFKSSYSDNGGACIEVAANLVASCSVVPVRDSKDRSGPSLAVDAGAWTAFLGAVKAGELPAV